VNRSFRQGLFEDKYEELVKEIHRPENCASLVKTRVNQCIWRLLKSWTQADDAKWSSIQSILVKATSSIVKLLDKLGSSDSEHLELGTTAVALLGHAYKTINVNAKNCINQTWIPNITTRSTRSWSLPVRAGTIRSAAVSIRIRYGPCQYDTYSIRYTCTWPKVSK